MNAPKLTLARLREIVTDAGELAKGTQVADGGGLSHLARFELKLFADAAGSGAAPYKVQIVFDDGVGKFMYIDGAKRYAAGVKGAEWKKGEPKLFDPSNSISQFDGLPESDQVPDYPCTGCPSSTS